MEAQDQFFDARSHGTSSVSMSRENSLTAVLPQSPSSSKDGRQAPDGAHLNTYQVTPDEPTGSGGSINSADVYAGAAQAPSQQAAVSDAMEVNAEASAAPTGTPAPSYIPDDPSIDPLEGDAVPLGNISPLSGDQQRLWTGEGSKGSTQAGPAPPPLDFAGDTSLLSLGEDVGASASDPFAAASPEPVLAPDDASEAWGTPQGGTQASESNPRKTIADSDAFDSTVVQPAPGGTSSPDLPAVSLDNLSLKEPSPVSDTQTPLLSPVRSISGTLEDAIAKDNATGLFGGLQLDDDADNNSAEPPAAELAAPDASVDTSKSRAVSPPSSPPAVAPSSPGGAAESGTLASRPLTLQTAGLDRTTAPHGSMNATASSREAITGSVRLPVSVPVRSSAYLHSHTPAANIESLHRPLCLHLYAQRSFMLYIVAISES